MRKLVLVRIKHVEKALADDAKEQQPRGLRKIVVPDMYADKEILLLAKEWLPWIEGKKPVIKSAAMQFSYFNECGEQKPHWHENQVEIYSTTKGQLDVTVQDVDNDENFELFTDIAGAVVIPPRYCHLMHVKGKNQLVQVIQFAVGRGPIKDDQQTCVPDRKKCPQARDCPRHNACNLENISPTVSSSGRA